MINLEVKEPEKKLDEQSFRICYLTKHFYLYTQSIFYAISSFAIPCIFNETLHDVIITVVVHDDDNNMTNAIITNVCSRDCTKLHLA